jgi:uncharacterized protein (TIGR02611 family)
VTESPQGTESTHGTAPERPDSDWEWRRRIRSNPHSHRIYRWVIGVVGLLIVAGGLALVPLPGPGWLIVIFGIIVWASEFVWAERLRDWVKGRLHVWNEWLAPQSWWVKAAVAVATAALVVGFFYLLFLISGVPSLLPDVLENWLGNLPGL